MTPALAAAAFLAGSLAGFLLGRRHVRHWVADWAAGRLRSGCWSTAGRVRWVVLAAVWWLAAPRRAWRGWRAEARGGL